MKTIIIVLLLLIGFLFVHPQIQVLFGQLGALEQMISHMRLTHSQLANNIDEVKQLIETNHTSEAHTLLEGMDVKINHMNTMFNDLVWELSNRGH
jgi:Tfp pilus assembly protein PilN